MLNRQRTVKILDMGLALLGTNQPSRQEMTGAGTAMGTADYVSPEQVTDSHSVDIRSDIDSLGCTPTSELSKAEPKPTSTAKPSERPQPISIALTPEPLDLPAGAPLSKMAVVAQPAAIATLRSWTIETIGHRGWVNRLAISPDGKTVATACSDGTIRLWNITTGDLLRAFIGHDGPVNDVSWSPDGRFLATASDDRTVQIWDPATGRRLLTFAEESCYRQVQWSGNGRFVAGVTESSGGTTVAVWEFHPSSGGRSLRRAGWQPVASGVAKKVVVSSSSYYRARLSWSPDGKTLAVGVGRLFLWDADTDAVVDDEIVAGMPDVSYVQGTAWSPDGRHIAFGRRDDLVVYDTHTRRITQTFTLPRIWAKCVGWSPAGKSLAAATETAFTIWALDTGKVRREEVEIWPGHFEWSPLGDTIAMALRPNVVRISDAGSLRSLRTLPMHGAAMTCLAWSEDGRGLASLQYPVDAGLRVWEVALTRLRRQAGVGGNWHWLAWRPGGNQLAVLNPPRWNCVMRPRSICREP